MIRKWLYVLLALSILYAFSKINSSKRRARFPALKKIDQTITILAWTLLAVYGAAFLYWLYTKIHR